MLTWLDDLARGVFDEQLATVEVRHCHLEAAERLHQADTLHHVEVAAFAAEILVRGEISRI